MKHNFDKVIDRRNTNSVKYDFAAECGMSEDVLPLWVADMDFQASEAVRQRLAEISRFGIYGYSKGSDGPAGACFAEKGGGIMSEKAIVAMSGGRGRRNDRKRRRQLNPVCFYGKIKEPENQKGACRIWPL